jgi:hypothetical protein
VDLAHRPGPLESAEAIVVSRAKDNIAAVIEKSFLTPSIAIAKNNFRNGGRRPAGRRRKAAALRYLN